MKQLIGNAVVGQSGGPTAAINATLSGVIRGAAKKTEIRHLYGALNGIEGILSEHLILLDGQQEDEASCRQLECTPAAALGSCRKKLPLPEDEPALYETLFSVFRKYDIRYFFYIGGNDSMDTAAKIHAYALSRDYEMRVIGVPKTIDNDIMGTDHTPGFGSAAKYVAATMQEILRDCAVYTVPAVTVVEIMGRDAGWLTAAAGLLNRYHDVKPDCIYLPERVFSYEKLGEDIRRALERHPNVVIAVSEGVRFADGTYVGESRQSGSADVFGHRYLSGVGKTLEIWIKEHFGCKVRSVELNILQRCAAHLLSAADVSESVSVGMAAVDHAAAGGSGQMMGFSRVSGDPYRAEIVPVALETAANHVRRVPDDFIDGEGSNVTDACLDYLFPLCEGEVTPEYRHGIPVHFVFDHTPF